MGHYGNFDIGVYVHTVVLAHMHRIQLCFGVGQGEELCKDTHPKAITHISLTPENPLSSLLFPVAIVQSHPSPPLVQWAVLMEGLLHN